MAVKLLLIDSDIANSKFSIVCSYFAHILLHVEKHLLSSQIPVSFLTSFTAHKGTLVNYGNHNN